MHHVETEEKTGRDVVAQKQPQNASMDQWKMPKWMQCAAAHVDRGELAKAAELLTEDRIKHHISSLLMPELGFVLVALARLLRRMSEFKRAESIYEQLLMTCPTNTSVLNEIALFFEAQGETGAAIRYLRQAVAIDPHDPRLWAQMVRMDSPNPGFEASTEDPALGTTVCWCGESLKGSVHPAYGRCMACGTFVLLHQYTHDQLKAFYTFDRYWHTQAVHVKHLPPIEQRVVNDLKDRIPALFELLKRCLGRYGLSPANLLEIGSAHGAFLAYCRKNGIKSVVGNEPDRATCQFAEEMFGLPHLATGLFPDVSLPFEPFDVIVGFDVVEHFGEPVRAMKKVCELLGKQGLCMFQLPCYRDEGAMWPPFKPPEHIYLYDSDSVRTLFDRAGLDVFHIEQGCFKYNMFVVGGRKGRAGSSHLVGSESSQEQTGQIG